ncbi:MAG: ribosome assembly RNA-binding protein YhbY [Chromatiales bacterium]|jgi:RNA-binding protein|nr:ribosome assembly RNA-binding protein YhbY [Chromatiales bacterium]
MHLSVRQKKHLRKLGHDLKPIVTTGTAGVTPAVIAELDSALEHHELVKIKVRVGDRQARSQALTTLSKATGALLIQRIGHVALVYRPDPENPSIILPVR